MSGDPSKRRRQRLLAAAALVLGAGALWLLLASGRDTPSSARTEQEPAAPDALEPASADAVAAGEAPALSGRVVVKGTRRGVASAVVQVVCGGGSDRARPSRQTTSREGDYAFASLPAGDCTVQATAPGHTAGGPTAARPFPVRIRDGQPLRDVEIALYESATVRGRVLTGETPVEDASLTVLYSEAPGEPGAFSLTPDDGTDARGRFALGDLGPGRLQVLAEHEGFALAESDEIFLRPGETVDGVVIRLAGGGELAGRVLDTGSRPVPHARVRLAPSAERGVRGTTADGRGRFRFEGVPPGAATVMVRALGYEAARLGGVEIVAGETTEVTLTLETQSGFGGIVRAPDGTPVPGAAVYLQPAGTRLPPGHVPLRPTAHTNDDGRFWIVNRPEGLHLCYATHPSYGPSDRVTVPDPGEEIELRLSAGGRLVGQVVDGEGEPLASFTVALFAFRPAEGGAARRGGLPRSRNRDPSGRFAFSGLAPGTYDLQVAAAGYPPVLSEGHAVRAEEETDAGVLVLTRGGAVVGTVIDAETGEPIPSARVSVSEMGMMGFGGAAPRATTDPDGRFLLEGLPPERLSLQLRAPRYVTRLVSGIQAPEAGEADAGTITLTPAGEGVARATMQYSGIGAVLHRRGDRLVIREAFAGSPAEASGLPSGTEILRVNGYETSELDLRQAVEMIRGEVGSELTLEVLRPGEDYPETIRVERGDIVTDGGGGR